MIQNDHAIIKVASSLWHSKREIKSTKEILNTDVDINIALSPYWDKKNDFNSSLVVKASVRILCQLIMQPSITRPLKLLYGNCKSKSIFAYHQSASFIPKWNCMYILNAIKIMKKLCVRLFVSFLAFVRYGFSYSLCKSKNKIGMGCKYELIAS